MENMEEQIIIYREKDIISRVNRREGEVKLGERLVTLAEDEGPEALNKYNKKGVKYVLVGIPESIGPVANFGNPGAENAWEAFLQAFVNTQSNRFSGGDDILCLGHINTQSLQKSIQIAGKDINQLRALCAQLDNLVFPVIEAVVKADLIPVVIGGGHNNSYPIIKGTIRGLNLSSGMGCINCDPHADFRAMEERHSGNGFSYAYKEKFLRYYFALGLHEDYNGENLLQAMDAESPHIAYSFLNPQVKFQDLIHGAVHFFNDKTVPVGLELDLDSIKNMPASAFTPAGITIEEARNYILTIAGILNIKYLHLPEGAPKNKEENKMVGKTLAYLVSDFIKASKTKLDE